MSQLQDLGFVQISRDPFARGDTVRRPVETTQGCAWCGCKRKSGKLFEYGWWEDGGRPSWEGKLFCSIDCRNSHS